jgi:GNAT superfamily N-acetyltransferase/predicted nucleotidyltransferase
MRIRLCRDDERDDILSIINAAAEAYRGVIPADRWHDPYMSGAEFDRERAAGVVFWGYEEGGRLAGVMGLQEMRDVNLIRHAYVDPAKQRDGIGGKLLDHLQQASTKPMLVGTWAAARWAIRFYERHGFALASPQRKIALLKSYWTIPERQIETSVVLANPPEDSSHFGISAATMLNEMNEAARTATLAFSAGLAASYRARLGERLIGAYLIGSLAHGGFSHRYSDIDMALITEDSLDAAALAALRDLAANHDINLARKLSLFWSDRSFSVGRLPPLDRVDYLDNAVPLAERERVVPVRPSTDEIRGYLKAAPFANWTESAHRFASMDLLAPADHKAFIRALLYPARLVYSWSTGRMGSNDEAVAFVRKQRLQGIHSEIIVQALECRSAGADPDPLFPARSLLPDQVESCNRFMAQHTSSS